MKALKFSIFILFYFITQNSFSLELTVGVISKGRDTIRNEEQKRVSPIIKSVIKEQSGKSLARSFGYTNLKFDDKWYRFTVDLKIHGVNVETKQYLGNWPLKMPAPILVSEQYAAAKRLYELNRPPYQEVVNPLYDYVGDKEKDELIELNISLSELMLANNRESKYGCLIEQPLRYGDVNGEKTLVTIVQENIILSSPDLKKPTFRLLYAREDETLAAHVAETYPVKADTDPQFISESGMDYNIARFYPAQRSYAKIFTGDFNQDQKQDLVMWRKAYKSRLVSDPIEGYQLDAELLVHYEMVGGEYIQKEADSETVKIWLVSKNLTWQKGFPTKSECAGQEGQLIPEMHDAILNDQDVLK